MNRILALMSVSNISSPRGHNCGILTPRFLYVKLKIIYKSSFLAVTPGSFNEIIMVVNYMVPRHN